MSTESDSGGYEYTPLASPTHIRVIRLEPSLEPSAPLQFSFLEGDVEDLQHKYEAISYTWGEPVFPHKLHHKDTDTHLQVTENLDAALRRFRRRLDVRNLWADAVCIDQKSDEDKGVQIAMMGQIFRNAAQVLVWLGNDEQAQNGLLAIAALSRIDTAGISPFPYLSHPSHCSCMYCRYVPDLPGILQFCALPWFRRRWVIQEVVLNADVVLFCNQLEITWTRLWAGMHSIRKGWPNGPPIPDRWHLALDSMYNLWEIYSSKRKDDQAKATNMLDLLYHFEGFECSQRRDRLLALSAFKGSLNISYSTDYEKVFFKFAVSAIQNGDGIALLRAACQRPRDLQRSKLPSWVPQWDKPMSNTFDPASWGDRAWKPTSTYRYVGRGRVKCTFTGIFGEKSRVYVKNVLPLALEKDIPSKFLERRVWNFMHSEVDQNLFENFDRGTFLSFPLRTQRPLDESSSESDGDESIEEYNDRRYRWNRAAFWDFFLNPTQGKELPFPVSKILPYIGDYHFFSTTVHVGLAQSCCRWHVRTVYGISKVHVRPDDLIVANFANSVDADRISRGAYIYRKRRPKKEVFTLLGDAILRPFGWHERRCEHHGASPRLRFDYRYMTMTDQSVTATSNNISILIE